MCNIRVWLFVPVLCCLNTFSTCTEERGKCCHNLLCAGGGGGGRGKQWECLLMLLGCHLRLVLYYSSFVFVHTYSLVTYLSVNIMDNVLVAQSAMHVLLHIRGREWEKMGIAGQPHQGCQMTLPEGSATSPPPGTHGSRRHV